MSVSMSSTRAGRAVCGVAETLLDDQDGARCHGTGRNAGGGQNRRARRQAAWEANEDQKTFIGRRLAGVEKRDVSKAAAAHSLRRVKHYFTDWPVNTLLACFLTWVDWVGSVLPNNRLHNIIYTLYLAQTDPGFHQLVYALNLLESLTAIRPASTSIIMFRHLHATECSGIDFNVPPQIIHS